MLEWEWWKWLTVFERSERVTDCYDSLRLSEWKTVQCTWNDWILLGMEISNRNRNVFQASKVCKLIPELHFNLQRSFQSVDSLWQIQKRSVSQNHFIESSHFIHLWITENISVSFKASANCVVVFILHYNETQSKWPNFITKCFVIHHVDECTDSNLKCRRCCQNHPKEFSAHEIWGAWLFLI